jgi:cytochrome c
MSKMMSYRCAALILALTILVSGIAFAAPKATPAEAEALVKKAIAYMDENGREKAFAEFSKPNGKFVDRELYLYVYDVKGKCLAHGSNSGMIGKNLMGTKDPDGKLFVKDLLQVALEKGHGWVPFKFENPLTKKVEDKMGYVEKYQDIMIGSGVYK